MPERELFGVKREILPPEREFFGVKRELLSRERELTAAVITSDASSIHAQYDEAPEG
jgi:hypothetical protein